MKINAVADGAERSGVVDGERREEVVINMSITAEALCERPKNAALNSLHSLALPANKSLLDVIAELLQLVQAIIGSELGEGWLRDLLDTLGKMDKPCPNCGVLHFAKEAFLWYNGGRVSVPYISQPKLFKDSFGGLHRHSESFLNNVRNINSFLAMASFTAHEEYIAGGVRVYKILGELYVNVSALYGRGRRPSFGN
ncbi:unnamed protein product [Toxocara canis]|uniref:WASH-7_N domain-containing protein n=1 Tax=Toxocara canis TaxID=6265 RepID=A0A183US15_TOXCA|nr:unnamed protein product [Toxocara canis]